MNKNKDAWKINDEARADLRILLYECKRDEPRKTYDQIGKEFGLSGAAVNKLVVEYCRSLNLPEPPVVLSPGEKYNRNKMLPVGTRLEIEGRIGTLITELTYSYYVLMADTNEMVSVSRIDLSIISG